MIKHFLIVVLFHLIYIHHACGCFICKLSSSLPYLSLPLLPSSTLKGNLLIYNKYDKYIQILNSKEFNYDSGDDSHTSSSMSSLSSMLSYLSHDIYDNQRRSVINFDHINNNSYYMNDARNDDTDDSDNNNNNDHTDSSSSSSSSSSSCSSSNVYDDRNNNKNNINLTNSIQQLMLNSILWYKSSLSPILPPRCRFLPTCSSYGIESIEKYGPLKGGVLTIWRIFRCNPFGGSGYDPPQWPPPDYFAGTTSKSKRIRR